MNVDEMKFRYGDDVMTSFVLVFEFPFYTCS